jgi:hypothetical protein
MRQSYTICVLNVTSLFGGVVDIVCDIYFWRCWRYCMRQSYTICVLNVTSLFGGVRDIVCVSHIQSVY